jgi:uncharacterized membrane protein
MNSLFEFAEQSVRVSGEVSVPKEPGLSAIEESIDIQSPLRTVYDHWTQFEDFPVFMQGISEVRQLDDTHLHWVAEVAGHRHEWDAEITEQKPDERVAWKNVDGTDNAGVVTFHRIGEAVTKVMVQMDFVPDGVIEKIGNVLGAPDRRVRGDLQRFKEMVEASGDQPGGWRGEVTRPDEVDPTPTVSTATAHTHDKRLDQDHGPAEHQSTAAKQHPDTPRHDATIQDVSTPFSPHEDDESPLGDSDQHSTA